MKLLVCTQAVDTNDPVLGFFVTWLEELAKYYETIEVICLREGTHSLPKNVHVHQLHSRIKLGRSIELLNLSITLTYDAVFVHMNQEYILVAGWLWRLLGKRMSLWRNHYAGSWLTDVAAAFCTKVFCTSKHSYTAKYTKTVLMPVGVDTKQFFEDARVSRRPKSILFLARMAPSKRPEMLVDALSALEKTGIEFKADFYGDPLPKDAAYYDTLKRKTHVPSVSFFPGVSNNRTPDIYRAHEIFVNTSPSGMLDKTIFEAAACGCRVLAASADWRDMAGGDASFDSSEELVERLTAALAEMGTPQSADLVSANSLLALGERLSKEIQ